MRKHPRVFSRRFLNVGPDAGVGTVFGDPLYYQYLYEFLCERVGVESRNVEGCDRRLRVQIRDRIA